MADSSGSLFGLDGKRAFVAGDAISLAPRSLDLPAGAEQQIDLTIRLDPGLLPDRYQGHVVMETINAGARRLPVTVDTRGGSSVLLVVAINSDGSVRSYKGPGLPIQPEEERAEIVAALRFVDYVTVFDEPTVDGLLLLLEPHIHAKGTEYEPETIPERESVRSYGAEIAIVGDPKAHSTSWLIERIRGLER